MTEQGAAPIRVIVVDDSPTARELLVTMLQMREGIQVVGVGATGRDAIRLVSRMKPDVLLMDVVMPELDGLDATREIMRDNPTPIILVTGTMMHDDLNLSFDALDAGALTVLSKPGMRDSEACEHVVRTVRSMARVTVVRRWSRNSSEPVARKVPRITTSRPTPNTSSSPVSASGRSSGVTLRRDIEFKRPHIIGMASSTGGPGTLLRILKPLPADYSIPILLVQHVTAGFATGFAEWLNGETALKIKLAAHGEDPRPGTVLIAPDDYHMQINFMGVIELFKGEIYHGLRPAANHLFHSLARIYGPRAMGIILTGMGDDGADGMAAMHEAGSATIAQDEESCVVYGMPREAVMRNAVDAILNPEDIARTLGNFVGTNRELG